MNDNCPLFEPQNGTLPFTIPLLWNIKTSEPNSFSAMLHNSLPTLFLFPAVYGYGLLIFPLLAMPTLAAYKK